MAIGIATPQSVLFELVNVRIGWAEHSKKQKSTTTPGISSPPYVLFELVNVKIEWAEDAKSEWESINSRKVQKKVIPD